MANIKIEIHKRNVEARLESLNKWSVPEEVKTCLNTLLIKYYYEIKERDPRNLLSNDAHST